MKRLGLRLAFVPLAAVACVLLGLVMLGMVIDGRGRAAARLGLNLRRALVSDWRLI